MKLRPYQQETHDATINYLKQSKPTPGIIVLPTGCGKTFQIAALVKAYKEKVLILCPSQEILTQNFNKYIEFGGEASIYSASLGKKELGHVTFATIGSVKKMGSQFKQMGVRLLITDECHLGSDPKGGMFKVFLKTLSPTHVIGYTATPFRLEKQPCPESGYSYSQLTMMNRSKPKFYTNIIHVYQIPTAVKNNFWAPVDLELIEFDHSKVKLNSTGSDFTDSSIKQYNSDMSINNKIYKRIKGLIEEGKASILVFLDSIENCVIMSDALGDIAQVVSADTNKKDRVNIVKKFKDGNLKVICCVSTLTTGFDFPKLECVIMGRPTNSLAMFYQIYGRVVRPYEGKQGLFIDYGGNINRFGKMEDITIEDFDKFGWGIFSNGRLLSGVPMGGKPITKKHLIEMEKRLRDSKGNLNNIHSDHLMTFGKYKDQPLSEMSYGYCRWLLAEAYHRLDKETKAFVIVKVKEGIN